MAQKKPQISLRLFILSDPAGIRTQDPYIKSVLLYQLSYGIIQAEAWYIKMVHSGTERKFNHWLTFVCKRVTFSPYCGAKLAPFFK